MSDDVLYINDLQRLWVRETLSDEAHSRVDKVEHAVNGTIMAQKMFLQYYPESNIRKTLLQRLNEMRGCRLEYIVSIHGAFIAHSTVCICMEYMDKGSFSDIYRRTGPIVVNVVSKVALAVLEGIVYLHEEHGILHQNIRPSNILLNDKGQIKLTDSSLSTIAQVDQTFIGSAMGAWYLSPEIIRGVEDTPRTLKSEIWALGISLVELILGRYPYHLEDDSTEPLTILEVLQRIVSVPPPRLLTSINVRDIPAEAAEFVDGCLEMCVEDRKSPDKLLKATWTEETRLSTFDMLSWATTI